MSEDTEPRKADNLKILPLGDSLTYGNYAYGENGNGGYRTFLWHRLQENGYKAIDFVGSVRWGPPDIDRACEGRPGWSIEQISGRIESWLRIYAPDALLLLAGTNDILNGVATVRVVERMSLLLDKITAAAPHVHLLVASLIGVRMPNEYQINLHNILAFNHQLPALVSLRAAQGKRIGFVDMYTRAGLQDSDYGSDGIHPNELGYRKMADVWYEALIQERELWQKGRSE